MKQHSGRALVIDDDPLLREFCAEALRREGFAVETVGSPVAALEILLF